MSLSSLSAWTDLENPTFTFQGVHFWQGKLTGWVQSGYLTTESADHCVLVIVCVCVWGGGGGGGGVKAGRGLRFSFGVRSLVHVYAKSSLE